MLLNIKNRNHGFSLVELAISITVVGLLIALVVKGGEMLENAKVSSTILQVEGYKAGIDGFRSAYHAWPGDYDRAETYIRDCDSAHSCEDGDGDGAIGFTGTPSATASAIGYSETLNVWKHLRLSGHGSGLPSGDDPEYGSALPAASAGGGFEVYSDTDMHLNGATVAAGHFIRYAGEVSTTSLTADQRVYGFVVRAIDRKIDDGDPRSGSVFGGSIGARCVDSTGYIVDELEDQTCLMFVLLD